MKRTIAVIFLVAFIFFSCSKPHTINNNSNTSQPPPPLPPLPPPTPIDTSGGFVFQSLYWELDTLDWPPPGIVTAVVDPSQFITIAAMAGRQVQVFVQPGSSQDWIYVPGWDWFGNNNPPPQNNGFVWYFASYPYIANSNFFIESTPTNYQLAGNSLKVKVKLL